MRCLTDAELQAVADNEAHAAARAHVAACPTCRGRVEETQRAIATLAAQADRLPGPSIDLDRRVRHALRASGIAHAASAADATGSAGNAAATGGAVAPAATANAGGTIEATRATAGATTLRRPESSAPLWRRRAWTSGLAAAALVVLAVFVIWPSLTKESHLSAAEILGRSLQTFSTTSGVETFDYDMQFEGVAMRTFVPEGGGALRMEQVIDHDHPGRYRVTKVDAHNALRLVLAQDPERGTRAGRFAVDDRMYYFKFTATPERARSFVSMPDLQRTYIRTIISIMQGMSDQKLATIEAGDGSGTYYAVQMPRVAMQPTAAPATNAPAGVAMWDLDEAHALVHAGDFHLKELSARGTFLGQPFGIAFTLVRHDTTPSDQIDASMFSIDPEPGDIVLEGEATNDPAGDVVLAALRALRQEKP